MRSFISGERRRVRSDTTARAQRYEIRFLRGERAAWYDADGLRKQNVSPQGGVNEGLNALYDIQERGCGGTVSPSSNPRRDYQLEGSFLAYGIILPSSRKSEGG